MRTIPPPAIPLPAPGSVPKPDPAPASGSGARVWLVRHAEVREDWQNRAYGSTDVPLSIEGEAQTRAMASGFVGRTLAFVVSSPLVRALAMGRAIAEASGARLTEDARLREIWRGEWQGLPTSEFRARWNAQSAAFLADPWHWKGHGGESDAQVCARVWPCLLESVARAHGGEFVIAAHYNVIRVLTTHALGLAAHESFAFKNDPACATLLVDSSAGWQLVLANAASAQAALAALGSRR